MTVVKDDNDNIRTTTEAQHDSWRSHFNNISQNAE